MSQKNATDYIFVYTQDELTCAYPHTEVSELNYGEALLFCGQVAVCPNKKRMRLEVGPCRESCVVDYLGAKADD